VVQKVVKAHQAKMKVNGTHAVAQLLVWDRGWKLTWKRTFSRTSTKMGHDPSGGRGPQVDYHSSRFSHPGSNL